MTTISAVPEDQDAPIVIDIKPRSEGKLNAARDKLLEVLGDLTIPKIKRSTVLKSGPNKGKKVTQRDVIIGTIGRTENFGFGRTRSGYKEFAANKKHPEVLEALIEYGRLAVPKGWKFSAMTLNHGVKAKKHLDEQNVGFSVISAVGDFTGGGLYVFNPDGSGRKTLDIHNKPKMFNGAILPHQTQPFKGDRWTIIYYNQKEDGSIKGYSTVGSGECGCEGEEPLAGGVFA
jgi:hypothetical protein